MNLGLDDSTLIEAQFYDHLQYALFRIQHAKSTTEPSKVSICTGKSSLDRGLVWIDYKNNNNLICGSFKQIQPRILPQTFCVHFFSSSKNKILFIFAEKIEFSNKNFDTDVLKLSPKSLTGGRFSRIFVYLRKLRKMNIKLAEVVKVLMWSTDWINLHRMLNYGF